MTSSSESDKKRREQSGAMTTIDKIFRENAVASRGLLEAIDMVMPSKVVGVGVYVAGHASLEFAEDTLGNTQ